MEFIGAGLFASYIFYQLFDIIFNEMLFLRILSIHCEVEMHFILYFESNNELYKLPWVLNMLWNCFHHLSGLVI